MVKKDPSSFRDPDGFIFYDDGGIYRKVRESYREEYEHLLNSGLYRKLTESGKLIEHEEVDREKGYKTLEPNEIEFISYPYEWSFSQLKDAAILTLKIQENAYEHGMSLKDASAYNIQFQGCNPILIDTLSFEKKEKEPWQAYDQFCRHFLAPLALMKYTDIRLSQLMKNHRDGIPLDLAAKLLPSRTKMRPGLLLHIHLHSKFQKFYTGRAKSDKRKMSERSQKSIIRNLKNTVKKLDLEPESGRSLDRDTGNRYTETESNQITEFLEKWSKEVNPKTVWSFDSNNAYLDNLARETDAYTISFHKDPCVVDKKYRRCKEKEIGNILPLVQNFANPSPGLGWKNKEREKLTDRGSADLGLALDFIHNLAISNNLPLNKIASFFHDNCENLMIDFIPKKDPEVQKMLSSREDIFDYYSVENFEEEFSRHYDISERKEFDTSKRTLYLMKQK